ncbi:MinD/ParA family ATP-binding protein [Actinoplanes utahensis]|uniref:MinD/ParA family ATP-binding protein n=1 Tax=Actinoplanes utahensis TaxID=1869 RepID=UPI000AF3BA0A|nr:cobalamin biosynthesis protein CobQ [Actinoplanes utahensis]GIF31525.1 hypothetical protein Aut01nite_45110 [Actinoplanes utahensis]
MSSNDAEAFWTSEMDVAGTNGTARTPGPAAGPWSSPGPAAAAGSKPITEPVPAVPRQPAESRPTPAAEAADPGAAPATERVPTLDDLLADRPAPPTGPATVGWRAGVRRLSGGLVAPRPGPEEMRHRTAVASVQRSLRGPKTVVIVNPKGGAHKTTAALQIAATFGIHRGGYVLAWDNNETRGTMGWRALAARHTNTAVDLLQDLDRFADVRSARVGDLDNYVRSQGSAQFDVLASDEDSAGAASIDAEAFDALHRTLSRFYRLLIVDTGNNMRARNWRAAVDRADQLVIVSTVREDTSQSAAWLADGLRANGYGDLVENAVTVLTDPAATTTDKALRQRLHRHFGAVTRAVLDVPYDPALVAGGPIVYEALTPSTRNAWLQVTAAIAEGL